MQSCTFYTANVESFTDHELVQHPVATPWSHGCRAFYVDNMRGVMVFVREDDHDSGLPVVRGR